ncbi:hypothetical protein [Agathobacter rectalis]|jgi:hypothetical protein|uniref:hypothetical protein n=1 Tax=Agathobacter rectalis TaxID=39491 RepID=UPI0027D21D78|nr:hypothetical protein [Agathobacter rectalis]MCB7108762.1 hypothetical protein [Agathobacter rectalis]MCG4812055.1 hypothetical protein [Agathobacter rectalis]
MILTIGLMILWALTITLLIIAAKINKSVNYGMELLCFFSLAYPILMITAFLHSLGLLDIFYQGIF